MALVRRVRPGRIRFALGRSPQTLTILRKLVILDEMESRLAGAESGSATQRWSVAQMAASLLSGLRAKRGRRHLSSAARSDMHSEQSAESDLPPRGRPLRLVPDYYSGSVTNEELNRPRRRPTEFSSAQLADTKSVDEYFAQRRAILAKSAPEESEGYVRYGSANRSQLGDEFAADWRELLPEDHPQRLIGPPLVIAGTPEADATLAAAHDALRAAMRSANQPPTG
jgi:hypothetical protein